MNEYKSGSTPDTSTNILKSFRLPRFVRIAEASGDARLFWPRSVKSWPSFFKLKVLFLFELLAGSTPAVSTT